MTKRIIVVTYSILALSTAMADGQNFDRLLLPREYQGAASRAYRAGVRDPVHDRSDYTGLRANVVRRYGTDQWDALPPAGPPRPLPPVDYDYRGYNYRSPGAMGSEEDRWNDGPPALEELRHRARLESVLRYRYVEPGNEPCRDGSCHGEPYSSYRPMGGLTDEYELARLARAQRVASRYDGRYPAQPTAAACDDDPARGQQIDRAGNYVGANVFGAPRVFNPDQPIRNLLRYVFP